SPNLNISRAEFAVIAATGLGLMSVDTDQPGFPDVANEAWYNKAVKVASQFGIVKGYDDNLFRGELQITREQGIAMIARANDLIEDQPQLSEQEIDAVLANYPDAAAVSNWARESVAQMIKLGILQGQNKSMLNPQGDMTRAETTALIQRL